MIVVSVVVPIYNVSQYIERGMGYILAQDYSSFEVILVDDGSTDSSGTMCDMWVNKDSRVRVFHKENSGAGSARNVGIDHAEGRYIYFFDIDDRIPSYLLSTLVTQMDNYQTDMMVFGYNNIDVKYNVTTRVSFNQQLLESNDSLRKIFVDEFILKVNGFPWNKTYRKSFLDNHNLRFEDQRIQQDEVFNLKCYQYVNRLLLSDSVLYDYYVYDKGNTRSRFIPERFDIYKSVYNHFCELRDFWELKDSVFENYILNRYMSGVKQCCIFNMTHKDCLWTKEEKKMELHRIVSDSLSRKGMQLWKNKNHNVENRLYIYSICHESLFLIHLFAHFFVCVRLIKEKLRLK